MTVVSSLFAGLLFGLGLAISGLINPAKVLNFLDVAGTWDPSLIFTMGAAVLVTMIGFRLVLRRGTPLFDSTFHLPTASDLDARLVGGSALFGVGWGLVGYCPGPALAALSAGSSSTLIFIVAMLAGMMVARSISGKPAAPAVTR
jgi:uncharacterized protein